MAYGKVEVWKRGKQKGRNDRENKRRGGERKKNEDKGNGGKDKYKQYVTFTVANYYYVNLYFISVRLCNTAEKYKLFFPHFSLRSIVI
jgi:hypothetical protein